MVRTNRLVAITRLVPTPADPELRGYPNERCPVRNKFRHHAALRVAPIVSGLGTTAPSALSLPASSRAY